MQVSNTLNNSIRILFNPRVEAFKLFDFLVVKSNDDRYIAEIVEIYDDKFDASQNVAKLKIFYKINENNEVMPYDNFTPNKECEIFKVKQYEIEKFINQDKETFIFGTNAKTQTAQYLQYDFFNNNAIILADKIDNANAISLTLARKIAMKKKTVVLDSTGIIEIEGLKKLQASKDFKMPLNYTTIDFIFDKCLSDASLEFQAICGEIINEIKRYAKKQELGFIPFNAFAKVLLQQYKATPYPELKLLLSRMKKYQLNEIFANNKKDYENLFKTIEKAPLTIVDLSGIEVSWQKAYLEYIIEDIKDDIYLITRINDENCDVDLINKIYCDKKNITFIPNVSYNYKKLPSIMQYCKNYILLPSLYQRTDFLNANFALSNLIADECIIFGENTDGFLYLATDYEIKTQEEKRKNYRKIALSLIEDEEETLQQQLGQKGDYFENKQKEVKKTDSEKLMEELSKFEEAKKEVSASDNVEQKSEESSQEDLKVEKESSDYFESVMGESSENQDEIEIEETEIETENSIELAKENSESEILEVSENSSNDEVKVDKDAIVLEEMEETPQLEIKSSKDNEAEVETVETEEIKEFQPKSDPQIGKVSIGEADLVDPETINLEELAKDGKTDYEKAQEAKQKAKVIEENENDIINLEDSVQEPIESEALSDDQLDFIEFAEASKEDEDIELGEIADASMDESFEEIVNSKPKNTDKTIEIDDNVKLNADIIEKPATDTNSSLPIFKEEDKNEEMPEFKEGDIVIHPKYGRGVVIKTLRNEQRQLIHVDFEQSDKKLLDPKVANIKLEQ